jgi:hypothetical protein
MFSVSGRFDDLVAVTHGNNVLFSFLERHVEGRALWAVGPTSGAVPAAPAVVSTLLSRLVAEAPWAPDVRRIFNLIILFYPLNFCYQILFYEIAFCLIN